MELLRRISYLNYMDVDPTGLGYPEVIHFFWMDFSIETHGFGDPPFWDSPYIIYNNIYKNMINNNNTSNTNSNDSNNNFKKIIMNNNKQ